MSKLKDAWRGPWGQIVAGEDIEPGDVVCIRRDAAYNDGLLPVTSDIKARLRRLVSGDWRERDTVAEPYTTPGWDLVGLPGPWFLCVLQLPTRCVARLGANTDDPDEQSLVAEAYGPDPVAALSALCCQSLAVSILHGLGVFPEVSSPDPAWLWWWAGRAADDYGPLYARVTISSEDGTLGYEVPELTGWASARDWKRWRRAPAPPAQP